MDMQHARCSGKLDCGCCADCGCRCARSNTPGSVHFGQETCDHSPVTNVEELLKKYGYRSIPLMVQEFIHLCPDFPQAAALATCLGEMMADLQFALIDAGDKRKVKN